MRRSNKAKKGTSKGQNDRRDVFADTARKYVSDRRTLSASQSASDTSPTLQFTTPWYGLCEEVDEITGLVMKRPESVFGELASETTQVFLQHLAWAWTSRETDPRESQSLLNSVRRFHTAAQSMEQGSSEPPIASKSEWTARAVAWDSIKTSACV